MRLKENIKQQYSEAIIKKCSEHGCSINLRGLPHRIILKGEKIMQSWKMCDCIIFVFNKSVIAGIVELKSKTIHANEIAEKLGNGLKLTFDILSKHQNSTIYPIILYKSIRSSEFNVLKRKKISFRGINHDIIHRRCGESFLNIIKEFN